MATKYKIPQPAPGTELAVKLENVSIEYDLPSDRINSIKEYLIRLAQRKLHKKRFYALRDINLEVYAGEIFGILGKNGAGKSTLMKVISRVLIPVQGKVWIAGVVHPLLQLGAGFHPELTGRENIYLNGTILGHSKKEVEKKYQEIIDFSEIGEFIESPLRTYSSGMQARLGFAVATAWVPDILILDEVLAVGDAAFREKCNQRILEYKELGTTIIVVSHTPNQIATLCQRAIWIDHGSIICAGNANEVSEKYNFAVLGRKIEKE
jgi:ABC-2 type transport system ATP-binding protein/lipopolysaccharide transport system ATP-binding protein